MHTHLNDTKNMRFKFGVTIFWIWWKVGHLCGKYNRNNDCLHVVCDSLEQICCLNLKYYIMCVGFIGRYGH